jgi:pentatricopeptide repeat protein
MRICDTITLITMIAGYAHNGRVKESMEVCIEIAHSYSLPPSADDLTSWK